MNIEKNTMIEIVEVLCDGLLIIRILFTDQFAFESAAN